MSELTSRTENAVLKSPETMDALRANILKFTESELDRMTTSIIPLLELRHDIFHVRGTEYVKDLPIKDQLYDDPSNNIDFISHDLGLRNGNALDYHQTTERYDKGISVENAQRNEMYRRAILATAQELGFIAQYPGTASSPIDREIGILDSELELIEEKVAAIVINAAAGMSNVKRVRDAVRNIEAGLIDTDRIILSGGTRIVGDAEKGRIKLPYHAGDTEFESIKFAAEDLLGVTFEDESIIDVEYGEALTAKVQKAVATIGNRLVTIQAVEAPFDTRRKMDDGNPAKRINTEEAFLATLSLLEGEKGAVVMESHDAWTPWQNLIGHLVYGLNQRRNVYPAGPFNAERVFWSEEGGKKIMDITAPQDVVDEIVKTYRQLVQMRVSLG